MTSMIFSIVIYLIPFTAIAFFVVSLCNHIAARKQYNADPNETNLQKKKSTGTLLIVSSVIMGVLLAVIIGFMALMFMAVAYM